MGHQNETEKQSAIRTNKEEKWKFPGGLEVKDAAHSGGSGSVPGWGTSASHRQGQKKKKVKIEEKMVNTLVGIDTILKS